MIRRILDLIVFPFYLIFVIVSFPLKMLWIVINDRREKSSLNREDSRHLINAKTIPIKEGELLEMGKSIFLEQQAEFENFFKLFLTDKSKFIDENRELLQEHWEFEFEQLREIEVIYIYGAGVGLLNVTDWTGEENVGEIEEFLDTQLLIQPDWTHVRALREKTEEEKQGCENFIKYLLKTIDIDLKPQNKKLIFLELGWDVYVYTVIDEPTFMRIIERFGTLFHGTEIL